MVEPTKRQIKIIMKMFKPPKGWRVIQWHYRCGKACPINRAIYVPVVKDKYTLGYYLHEVAHVHFGHVLIKNKNIANPPGSHFRWHIQEAEAEIFTILALHVVGFPPTKRWVDQAKIYVKSVIKDDRRFKRRIDADVLAWTESKWPYA